MTFQLFYTTYKKIIWAVIGCVALIILLAFVITKSESWYQTNKIKQAEANINAAETVAANINANIGNLQIQAVQANANLQVAQEDLKRVQNEVDQASNVSNQAANNVNAVMQRNYNGTSTDDANRARCSAFPNSAECH